MSQPREKAVRLSLYQGDAPGTKSSPRATELSSAAAERDPELLQVGELAKATGKTVRAIHLYEELGLLRAHERSKGRYRLFTEDAVVRVRWIAKLQGMGLSLSAIQELVREQETSGSALRAATRLRDVYRAKLSETRAKLSELAALERELEESLTFLETCDTACESELPVHSCPTCERHPERPNAPELISALHLS